MSEDRNITFLKKRMKEASNAGDYETYKHYEDLLELICKRMNEKASKSND